MSVKTYWISVLLIAILSILISKSIANTQEKRLLTELFDKYNKELRPVLYPQDKVTVKFGLALVHLLELNTREQYMKANVWIRLVWNDISLKFNEALLANDTGLRVSPDLIWLPDIKLWNTKDGKNKIPLRTNVLIYSNGEVLWVPPAVFTVSCTIDATYFPFDQHVCAHKYASSSYNGAELGLAFYNDKPNVDLSDYWKNDHWEIIEVPAVLNSYTSPRETHPTEDITYYFTFRRRVTNYVVLLILFSILLAVITIFPFILPTHLPDKLILELGCLVGAMILLIHVRSVVTSFLLTPLIAKYLLTIIILNLISLLSTILTIYFNTINTSVPNWIDRYVLKYGSKFLICDGKSIKNEGKKAEATAIEDGTELNSIDKGKDDTVKQSEFSNVQKWRNLALIMERVLCIIFIIIIIAVTIHLLSKNYPRYNEDKIINVNTGV